MIYHSFLKFLLKFNFINEYVFKKTIEINEKSRENQGVYFQNYPFRSC